MEIVDQRPPIKSFVRRQLVVPDPIDFEKQKRIKRTMALFEKHKFKKTFLDERALSSNRFYSKKQARELDVGFNMHNNNVKTINRFLKRQPNLTRLSLTFSYKLNDLGWANMAKSLGRFPHICKLNIHFERQIQKIKDETLEKIRKYLKRLPRLKDVIIKCGTDQPLVFTLNLIQLGFTFNSGLVLNQNASLMETSIRYTRQLLKLTTVKLDPVMNASITDWVLGDLGRALLQLKNLQKVSFNSQKCTALSFAGIDAFLDYLLQASKLTKLKLGLFIKEKVTDTPFNYPLWKLNSFKNVSLDLMFSSDCDTNTLEFTMEAIRNIPNIRNLRINLTGCPNVTDKLIETIGSIIQNLPRIRKLHLDFAECQKISDVGVSALFSSVVGLKGLEQLFLDFSSCCTVPVGNVNNNWEENIRGLKKLTQASLLFNGCIGISEGLINGIIDVITGCKHLKQLCLGVNKCEAVKDKTLRGIGKGLRKLEELMTLKLEFGKDRDSIRNTQKGIRNTKNMMEIESGVVMNTYIEDKGFVGLGRSISRFKNLKDVTIDIKDCDSITQEGLQEFCRCFFNVYNLHKFVLNGNLDNPPRELWKIASELDEKLPHRYLFVMQFKRCSSGTERFARGI